MDNTASKKERESMIEDKLKKILFGSKSPRQTIKNDNSSHSKDVESVTDTLQLKEGDGDKDFKPDFESKKFETLCDEKQTEAAEDNLNLASSNSPQHNFSVNFNDKFSFADKVTFESEKFKNDEIMNFNQYIKTDPENDTINNENFSVYSKKILKNNYGLKKKDSSFTSEKQVNESLMSEKTQQSNQFSLSDHIQSTNIKDIVKNNTKSENQYLHIIEYKLQLNKENKFANFHSHNTDQEKTRNDQNNPLNTINNNSFNQSNSMNNSLMNTTLNTQKKDSFNTNNDKNKVSINNTISTSATINNNNKKISNNSNLIGNQKIKISNKNFDSNKNDLNKYLSNTKKDDSKYKEVKNTTQGKNKISTNRSSNNVSKDEIDTSETKKTTNKSKDKKPAPASKEAKSNDQKSSSIDKVEKPGSPLIHKHVKTSSVSSVKNLKNNDLLMKYEPLSQRSASNINTSFSGGNSTTNIKKIKIDNININVNDDKKKFENHINQIKNLNFFKEKYLKNREKVKKANDMILKLRTKLKIEQLKNQVKNEKQVLNETHQQMLDRAKRNNPAESNDITAEKMESLLNLMNVKHGETVSNVLSMFKTNKNLNDAFIGEIIQTARNDKKYYAFLETIGKAVNQLLLTNLNIRENDLKIIQNQQIIIDNYENSQQDYDIDANDANKMLSVSKDKDDYDTIQLADFSSLNEEN